MQTLFRIIVGAWLAVGAPVVSADDLPAAGALDPRVANALKAAGLAYVIDEGDYSLNYTLADGRTQRAWVASKTARIARLEFRDVWSVAYRGQGLLPASLANRLLTENVRMVMGAWQVNQGKDEYLVVFSYPIAADADAETLQEVIEAVTLSADRMEKELTGEDKF
jgi:hypothetical protein